jgi:hypothetical protein
VTSRLPAVLLSVAVLGAALAGCTASSPAPTPSASIAGGDLAADTSLLPALPTLAEVQKAFTSDWTVVTKATELTSSPTTVGTRSATSQCENTYVDMTTVLATATRTTFTVFTPSLTATNDNEGVVEYLLPSSADAAKAYASAVQLSTVCPQEAAAQDAKTTEHTLDTSSLGFTATGFSTIGSGQGATGDASVYAVDRNVFFVATSQSADATALKTAELMRSSFTGAGL